MTSYEDTMAYAMRFLDCEAHAEEDDFDVEEDVHLILDDKGLLKIKKLKNSNKEWLSELHKGSPR